MMCLKDPGSTSEVYVSSPFEENLSNAKFLIQYLTSPIVAAQVHIRQQCHSYLEPIICLYSVHLCKDGMDIGPSEEQCKRVSNACDEELKQIKGFMVEEYLSNCAPESQFNKDCIVTSHKHTTILYNCNEGFYQDLLMENGRCQPECNVWSPYRKGMVLTTDILNIFAAVVCIISGIAVLVLSWLHHQK